MNLNSYQRHCMRTANNESTLAIPTADSRMTIAVAALGIGGEAGEVQELIKKWLGHGHMLDREKLTKELGDVLWYVARIAAWAGVSLEDVANANLRKLAERYPDGFSPERSQNRTEQG